MYGRRMLKGVLESKGIKVSEGRVAAALRRVAPLQYEQRRHDTGDRLNPSPYIAFYFGHKVHLDQNGKLRMFGVAHIIARDGYSGKIVGFSTMPVKNNLALYESIYRYGFCHCFNVGQILHGCYSLYFRVIVTTFGLWSQLRVDHGREFYLTLFIQEYLRSMHGPSDIIPYVQSTSKEVCVCVCVCRVCNFMMDGWICVPFAIVDLFSIQNLTVERIWPEVNSRVNYPIKRILIYMQEQQEFDLTDATTKFCVSSVTCNVCRVGLSKFVAAWNFHSIPGVYNICNTYNLKLYSHAYAGRGVPNALQMECNRLTPLQEVPSTNDAAQLYRSQGGSLVQFGLFGVDPLHNRADLIWQRETYFFSPRSSFDDIFSNVVTGDGSLFREAILDFITVTKSLQLLM